MYIYHIHYIRICIAKRNGRSSILGLCIHAILMLVGCFGDGAPGHNMHA